MNKKTIKIMSAVVLIFIIILGIIYLIDLDRMENNKPVLFSTWGRKYAPPLAEYNLDTDMNIVLSLEDKVANNSAWCGTFNLIWNDLRDDLAKQDIVFNPQLDIVTNLNKGTFNTSYLSENSYYKVYGTPSLTLKAEIEKSIKEKFNETSDILNDFNWTERDSKDYFLYAMLKKEFEFPKVFTKLENGTFGNFKNVKYFGINSDTDSKVRDQVQVLYYNSKEDFAVKLLTKGNDEVIIAKGIIKNTFGEVYKEIMEKKEKSTSNSRFTEIDILKIPNITFNMKKEIEEIQNKKFLLSNGDEYTIEKALQTIQFELDEKGGKIKSESGMMLKNESVAILPSEKREFIVDDTFTIFLQEKDKELPYFAAKISDISNVQSDVSKVENKVSLKDLPKDYPLEQAISDGCVVITKNKVYNQEKLDKFIQNTSINSKERKEDTLIIVSYTREGDAIIKKLTYKIKEETYVLSGSEVNKTSYILKVDNTRDKYSAEDERKITVDEDIPGNIYTIVLQENCEEITLKLALVAQIQYADSNSKIYNDIEICSYLKSK